MTETNPFGGAGGFDMNALLQQAQAMQEQMVAAQQELVAEVRALVVDAEARRGAVAPLGHRQADEEVGVEQVVGVRVEVELREHAAREREPLGRRCA